MSFLNKVVLGATIGAALMYMLDPENGARRRAELGSRTRDVNNKLRRAAANRRHHRSSWREEPVNDHALAQRVHSAIENTVSHPDAIDVTVLGGDVALGGVVFKDELPLLIDSIYDIPGVRSMSNRLIAHSASDNAPALQGPSARKSVAPRARSSFLKNNWSPAVRITAGLIGAAGAAYGLLGRGWASRAIGLSGGALLTRAATNLDFVRLLGISRHHRFSIAIQKSIDINAPIERVFDMWADCANFPHFMTHVREVQPLDQAGHPARRWHWKLRGSSGIETEFTSEVTAYEHNGLIAWRSEEGALAQHAGYVRFTPKSERTTRIDIRLAYTPVAGAVGHVIAKLLGDDPRKQMDDDLQRMKTFIETDIPPRDAAVTGATLTQDVPRQPGPTLILQ